jgi:hypothetical protein
VRRRMGNRGTTGSIPHLLAPAAPVLAVIMLLPPVPAP